MTRQGKETAIRYFPYLLINDNEPFLPERIGVTFFYKTAASPSFRRDVVVDREKISFVIEYAVFFTYDIEHLYDLEHIWVYVGHDGKVVDCEGSYHGKYVKALKGDRSNLIEQRPLIFCQPGKHAFSAYRELLELDPGGYFRVPMEAEAVNGLLITHILAKKIFPMKEVHEMVNRELVRKKFMPALTFHTYLCDKTIFMPWTDLNQEIPRIIEAEIMRLKTLEEL